MKNFVVAFFLLSAMNAFSAEEVYLRGTSTAGKVCGILITDNGGQKIYKIDEYFSGESGLTPVFSDTKIKTNAWVGEGYITPIKSSEKNTMAAKFKTNAASSYDPSFKGVFTLSLAEDLNSFLFTSKGRSRNLKTGIVIPVGHSGIPVIPAGIESDEFEYEIDCRDLKVAQKPGLM